MRVVCVVCVLCCVCCMCFVLCVLCHVNVFCILPEYGLLHMHVCVRTLRRGDRWTSFDPVTFPLPSSRSLPPRLNYPPPHSNIYRLTYEHLSSESTRLVHAWHLRGRTVLFTCGTVQLFFDFLLHLIYFCYKYISIHCEGHLFFFPDDTQI